MSHRTPAARLAARMLVLAVAGAAAASAPAAAHVTAQPPEQVAGGFTKIVFRTPNERDKSTIRLRVQLPPELDSVRVQPVSGWRYRMKREELAQPRELFGKKVTHYVSEIEWTGGRLGADEFQEFPVSMKLPEKGTFGPYITFGALQYYEGGEVVRWIQKPASPEGNWDDLESPAAKIELTEPEEPDAKFASFATQQQLDDEIGSPRTMSLIATIAAGAALLLALAALLRRRRSG